MHVDHLDGGGGGLEPLVGPVRQRAGLGLVERVHGEHAERHRHPGLRATPRCMPCDIDDADVVEVRRLAAHQAAETDDRVEAARVGGHPRRQRQLEGARHVEDLDASGARLASACCAPVAELPGDVLVEAGDHDGEGEAPRHAAAERRGRCRVASLGRAQRPLNSGLALLDEGARAFLHVLGGGDQPEQRRLEGARVREAHLDSPRLTASMREPQRHGRTRGERPARTRGPPPASEAAGHHARDEPDGQRLVGGHHAPGQDQVERPVPADEPRQPLRARRNPG